MKDLALSDPSSASTQHTTSESSDDTRAADMNGAVSTRGSQHGSWKGWAEIENDPVIFSTLLQEWGISNIQVNEVVALDSIFETSSDSMYGLIFLSRWTAIEETNEVTECPPGVWFANQTSGFSCASIALLNIINNSRLSLGTRLDEFRRTTMDMSPKDRGLAIDQFDHVRDVHNSFATTLDKMNVDWKIREDVVRAEKKQRALEAAKNKPTPKRRKKVKSNIEEDENGFHFIAYVLAKGCVWKMDGMQPQPWKLTELGEGDDWLMASVADLQQQWESAAANALEFSLLSLTPRSDFSSIGEEDEKMARAREDWGPFLAHMVDLHSQKGNIKQMIV